MTISTLIAFIAIGVAFGLLGLARVVDQIEQQRQGSRRSEVEPT